MPGDSKTALERETDSLGAQCEPGVRRYLEQAAWDTRLVMGYFLCKHVIKQRGLDIRMGDFTL